MPAEAAARVVARAVARAEVARAEVVVVVAHKTSRQLIIQLQLKVTAAAKTDLCRQRAMTIMSKMSVWRCGILGSVTPSAAQADALNGLV